MSEEISSKELMNNIAFSVFPNYILIKSSVIYLFSSEISFYYLLSFLTNAKISSFTHGKYYYMYRHIKMLIKMKYIIN